MSRFLASLALMLAIPLAFAGKPPVFSTGDGAIRGYDPVAYFTNGEPPADPGEEGVVGYKCRVVSIVCQDKEDESKGKLIADTN